MDFFGSQDAARRKSGFLVFYFVIAVALMILTMYVAVVGTVSFASLQLASLQQGHAPGSFHWWQPEIFLLVVGGTITIITIGSLYKTMQLHGGGAAVAEQLGGRHLQGNSRDPLEQRLLNVVEEMALAAGTSVPAVYLLDKEPSINAFAAGFTPGDAVIGVNRGTVEHLSRDELQGVIAHEFSHILNGDMRLNLRLMGLLHGILLIAIIGYYVVRGGGHGSSSRRDKGGGWQILLIGFAMIVIGYVGLFFARLIKAAVSRQREYLADASAVQFTRNPDGIAGALKKIGALPAGSRMETAEAESASHLFFGNSRGSLFQALATHPPLVERIQRIDPRFDGDFSAFVAKPKRTPPQGKKEDSKSALEGLTRPLGGLAAAGMGNRLPIDPVLVMATVGEPTMQHVDYVHGMLERLPGALRDALHDPFSCRAVIAALLLDRDVEVRARQLQIVRVKMGGLSHQETNQLAPLVEAQGPAARLPLIEIAGNTLQDLSPSQYETFREVVVELIKADEKIDLFEFVLQRVLLRHLDQHFHGHQPPKVLYPAIGGVRNEVSNLISALSHLGHADQADVKSAFDKASAAFAAEKMLVLRARGECSLKQIGEALDKVAQSSPAVKKRVLKAATVSVMADGFVTIAEGELLRAIANSIDCPLPPLLSAATASGS